MYVLLDLIKHSNPKTDKVYGNGSVKSIGVSLFSKQDLYSSVKEI